MVCLYTACGIRISELTLKMVLKMVLHVPSEESSLVRGLELRYLISCTFVVLIA
ncbi:hypothetical protein M406DRAFT_320671 [Cryphonectria parasitica EP155]|uniref:Uncharacterized protein n=1 Tax=Cryphonectria parasitica (strain ATCC 38755 / EP155) TaxID=660469 RepID=A0A9P5CV97_CRYP1|nr:uncharacterized protein M406DRAFT_320671 [Cryphonectria parasitica EP155]KAF3771197.1 hypothetical protein M406DRAFT_320671 [Cryphonectria parasitica EP155]